jgi:hypothetical protein
MSGEELQQHLKEIGDEVDKIVTGQTSESSTTAAATASGGDDVPSSSESLLPTRDVCINQLCEL